MHLARSFALAALAASVMVSAATAADTAPATGSASGTVVLQDGKPAAGATITALSTADRSRDPVAVKTVSPNNDGTFKVEGLAAGGYIFKFATKTQAANKSVTITAGKDAALGKITLKPLTNTGMKSEPPKNSGPRG